MGMEPPMARPCRCPQCGTLLPSYRTDRQFFLSDAMILVAASAISFVILRSPLSRAFEREPGWAYWLAAVLCGLVSWTPALLLLRLRSPRPLLRLLTRQPGFAATLAGTSIIVLATFVIGLLALVRVSRRGAISGMTRFAPNMPKRLPDPYWWLGVVLHFGALVGPTILGAWLLLVVSGRRRAAKGWIDLLGRVLGILWIALFVINCCARFGHLRD